jgi:hypothetical protein
LWGTVKEMVYQEEPSTIQNMQDRIRNAFVEINRRNLAANVLENFQRRLRLCIENDGHRFEHLL